MDKQVQSYVPSNQQRLQEVTVSIQKTTLNPMENQVAYTFSVWKEK